MGEIEEWVGTTILGAILAALGYVSKLLIELWLEHRERTRNRQCRLVELNALLGASKALFRIQNDQVKRLCGMLKERLPDRAARHTGYEAIMSGLYDRMNEQERELHGIIRSSTVHGIREVNRSLLDWIRDDTTYRGVQAGGGNRGKLGRALLELETHLLLWHAKYETWIPDRPEHALVYMADEQKHGPGFPKEIDTIVKQLIE